MRSFLRSVVSHLQREDGPKAIGYASMLALVALVCFSVITSPGTKFSLDFAKASTALVAGS
jgi:Flp pilus assembly pilin Flp